MKGITIGLLVAAGVAGIWAAQRASAQRHAPQVALRDQPTQPGVTAKTIPNVTARRATPPKDSIDPKMVITPKADIDPKMVITPKENIDPKIVVNPPPPPSPDDKTRLKPNDNH